MLLMRPNPKISIVMPMYRVERYIEKAIRSVLVQDFQDWELLIVNDGSPDNSRKIAMAVAVGDDRIKILDKENGGLSDARNFGLDRATGEFVHFYDSDDWIEPDFYSTLLKSIEDFDLVVCGYKVDNEKFVTEHVGYVGELSEVVGSSLHHLVGTYLNFAWNKLFRRLFLINNTLYYEKGLYRIEDAEFMMRFLSCSPKVNMIEYTGYHYMVRNTATLSKFFDENIFEHLNRGVFVRAKVYKLLCDNEDIISEELGKSSFLLMKATLYMIADNIPFYDIIRAKCLINKVINSNDVYLHIIKSYPQNVFDRFFLNAIKNKRWWLIWIISQLRRMM